MKEILAKMKEAGEKSDDPVMEAVTQVADYTVQRSEQQDKRLEEQDAKIGGVERSVVHEAEKVRTEMETGFKIVADKLEAVSKRSSIVSGMGHTMFEPVDKVLSSIPENKRHLIRRQDAVLRSSKHNPNDISQQAILQTAKGLWFANSIRLQMKSEGESHEQDRATLKAISAGFEDAYGKASYNESVAGQGGYLVPEIISADILRIMEDSAVVVSRARHIPMSSDTLLIPNEATGITTHWAAEAGTLTQGEGTFGQNTLTAKKLIGRAKLSREVVDDAVVGIVPYLQEVFAEEFGRILDGEALEGTGTNFTGVVTDAGNTVATTTTDGEALVYQDLVDVIFAGGEESTRAGAGFFMSPKLFAKVVGLVDSTGQPIVKLGTVESGINKSILGFPVWLTNKLSTTITRGSVGGTSNMYFGDPKKLIFGDRMGMRFEVTDQVGWANDQIDVRMIGRWGFTVATPAAWTKLVGATIA